MGKDKEIQVLGVVNNAFLDALKNDENIIIKQYTKVNDVKDGDVYINEPRNYLTDKAYTGMNAMMLKAGYYITFSQLKTINGKVKKGAKSIPLLKITAFDYVKIKYKDGDKYVEKVLSKSTYENEKDKYEDAEIIDTFARFFHSYFRVFNINDCEEYTPIHHENTIKTIPEPRIPTNELSQIGEFVKDSYLQKTSVKLQPDCDIQASAYNKKEDKIYMKNFFEYANAEQYYHELFHEIAHSTGAENRLKRKELIEGKFGDSPYSVEEMIAETTSTQVIQKLGLLTNELLSESTNYVKSWYETVSEGVKTNPNFLISIFNRVDKAVNYILSE